jgi:hypothetical protein
VSDIGEIQADPNQIIWDRDPAASGWRSRAFLERGDKRYELVAYDDGGWWIYTPPSVVANGYEADGNAAMARCIRVLEALL